MAEKILDVHLDFDPLQLAGEPSPTRAVYEVSHKAALDKAAAEGGFLRHPDPRETVISEGQHPITGADVLLVSTRWIVDTPQG